MSPETGEELDVAIDLTGGDLRVLVGHTVVGEWAAGDAQVRRLRDGDFVLVIDGEKWRVFPENPTRFAAEAVETVRPIRNSEAGARVKPSRRAAVWLSVAVSTTLVIAFGVGLIVGRYRLDGSNPATWTVLVLLVVLGVAASIGAVRRVEGAGGSSLRDAESPELPPGEAHALIVSPQDSAEAAAADAIDVETIRLLPVYGVHQSLRGDHILVDDVLTPRLQRRGAPTESPGTSIEAPARSYPAVRMPPAPDPDGDPVGWILRAIDSTTLTNLPDDIQDRPATAAEEAAQEPLEPITTAAAEAGGPSSAASGTPPDRSAGRRDDLTELRGIGPGIAEILTKLGITTFAQVAHLTVDQVEQIQHLLGSFPDRIERDDWRGNAEQAHMSKYGVPPEPPPSSTPPGGDHREEGSDILASGMEPPSSRASKAIHAVMRAVSRGRSTR